MGKKRRATINSNPGEDPEQGRIRAWWGRQKQKVSDKVEDALDKATAEAQRKYYPRWMAGSGTNNPKYIKWDDPQISLECKLCDPRNLKLIRGGKNRDKFFMICSEEEIDVYLNKTDANGHKYTDLESPHVLRDTIGGIKEHIRQARKKKGGDITPEEEEALNSLLADDEEGDNGTS